MSDRARYSEAMRRLERRIVTLNKICDWRDSLELRLDAAAALVEAGLPDPHFDALEAEVVEFTTACARLSS